MKDKRRIIYFVVIVGWRNFQLVGQQLGEFISVNVSLDIISVPLSNLAENLIVPKGKATS